MILNTTYRVFVNGEHICDTISLETKMINNKAMLICGGYRVACEIVKEYEVDGINKVVNIVF